MASKSDFEKILDQYLKPEARPKAGKTEAKVETFQFDLYSQIPFLFGPIGTGSVAKIRKAARKIPMEPPPPKVKRKLTFDQEKALKVFNKFGENQINEYSTDDEIKGAFRLLAKKFHPDFSKNNGAEFRVISGAYEKILP